MKEERGGGEKRLRIEDIEFGEGKEKDRQGQQQ